MIARSNRAAWWALRHLILPVLFRGLHAVRFLGEPHVPRGRPLLVLANHVSWWDGFLVERLVRRLRPQAPLYTVMLERELARAPFLRLTGGLGLVPGSMAGTRALLRALERERARRNDLVVQFFPQGSIYPSRRRPLGFQDGFQLVARALGDAVLLPVGIHLEPFNHPRSTALVTAGEPWDAGVDLPSAVDVERRVTHLLDDVLAAVDRDGERWHGGRA
ncbi:MAG: 1-acyl-sn-glycerol-3-phosphate acyltransferase [Gemmatimonadota bacterium]